MSSIFECGKWISHPPPGEEVVISGVAGRFPESNNLHEFKENLFNKTDMTTVDDRRWKIDHPEVPKKFGKVYNIDKLDGGYFGLHYRQADNTTPLLRKAIECALEAIMDAGLNPSELEGSKTAVLMGICYSETEKHSLFNITEPECFGMTGHLRSFIAHRVSYFLKLKGPSMTVDTACGSSLNAFELASRYIRMGMCDNAIVGGVNLLLNPGITRQYFRLGVLSPNGVCSPFDKKANGYVRSESASCIFLQKAKNAKRIYAQVIHAKVNCDGFKQLGITFPSTQMQAELISSALEESGVDACDISFLEAHGTGTIVGDPQEVEAIDNAIAKIRAKPLLIGSVKSSIGHTEPASGLCSIAKVIIAMETGYIPPNIHMETIKEGICGLEEERIKVVTELTKLGPDDNIFGVNNFGFGGNNTHILLKRFEKVKANRGLPEDDISRLVCVSGRTKKAVSTLLDDINKNSLDREYVGLLHQIFKQNIPGHVYRGYSIISKTGPIKTDIGFVPNRKRLCVTFGNFKNGYKLLGEYLQKFLFFKTMMKKIHKIIPTQVDDARGPQKDIFGSLIVQIGVIELFKVLEIEPEAICGDSVGKLVTDYYYKKITLTETVHEVQGFIETHKSSNFADTINETVQNCGCSPDLHSVKKRCKNLILNVSDNISNNNSLPFVKNKKINFLEVLGRLYQEGYNPQLYKLYPTVEYPVSRNTAMISPLIQWDYRKSWYTYKFGEFKLGDVTQQEYYLSTNLYEDQKYMLGHVIDGRRNLVPATKYLELVQRTLLKSLNMPELDELPIVFENCKFIKAVTLPNDDLVSLLVTIQKKNGYFEIVNKNSVVVSGKIFLPEVVEQYQNDLPISDLNVKRSEYLENDEIYRELYIRGYNYTGLFKGMAKCNADISASLITWENNLTTFLDKMLQMRILLINSRSLYVPIGIKRLSYNALKHAKFTESCTDSLCTVFFNKETDTIKSGGIEICGLKATAILKKKSTVTPVLEKNIFVSNNAQLAVEESLRVITQIILENSLENDFKSIEILDDRTTEISELLLSPLISNALEDVPAVNVNLTISSKTSLNVPSNINVENFTLTSTSNMLLIIATNIFQKQNLLNQVVNALSPNGFLLSREKTDFVFDKVQNIELLLEHVVGDEKLILLHKEKLTVMTETVEIVSQNYNWLPQLQKALKRDVEVIVYSQNAEPEGILGLVNCLRREPKGRKVKCFLMLEPSPKFDIKNPFYETQIRKQLAFNIYKNGKWGTYRHLLLEDIQEIEGQHFFVRNMVKGDLRSLQWVEGSLTPETKLSTSSILVFPVYSSLNFKDIMIASGRVSVDNFTLDRIKQECCLGFEFAGFDTNGLRVMGMNSGTAMATIVEADKRFLWTIPDSWTFEEASTVVAVYATVIYGLLEVAQLKEGMSILIHSGTGGIGLAALNVCLFHNCNIYVTVGTQEKRDYLRKNFPQIPENHIGNSRDTSFVEMIKTGTNGSGVDVLLNSLSEEKLRASIQCVATGGNFIEIGQFDLGIDASLDLLLLEKNINYHGVMLDRLSLIKKLYVIDKMYEGIKLGYVKPLPRTVFKRDEIIQAYKFMTTGKHIGKVVVQIRDENEEKREIFKGTPRFTCNPEKSYIIVGGLGGFGLELADWLYLRGVKNLILVSRSGIQSGYQRQRIENWKSCGVNVQISTADVTTKQGCLDLIKEANKLGHVDGIFNLAVVLRDAIFEDQDEEAFNISLAPKAKATIHLDQITRESCLNLRRFVVFSSVSCGRGNVGQTNYGMANSIMERICERRKLDGLPGLAIQWGAIGDVGLVAKMQKENKELVIGGTLQQKISSCLEVLDKFLNQDNPIISSMVVADKTSKSGLETAVDVVAYILGIKDVKTVNPHTTLAELGIDSMMATEMIQILEKDFSIYITAKEARNLTFAKLAEMETQSKTNEDGTAKTEKATNFLLKYVPSSHLSNSPLIKLESQIKDDANARRVFVFPGAEGVFEELEFLTKNLNAHLLGIQYSYYRNASSVEEYAKEIIQDIEETISTEKTLHIIGYSFGGVLATEVISLLEVKGFTGTLITIDSSPVYLSKAVHETFPVDNENEFQTLFLFKIVSLLLPINHLLQKKDTFLQCKNLDERFELAKSQLPPEFVKDKDLKKQAVTAFYNRFKSMSRYKFENDKLKSLVHLFKARRPLVSDVAEDYGLATLCERDIQITSVDGDHYSILNQKQLVDDINKLLTDSFI